MKSDNLKRKNSGYQPPLRQPRCLERLRGKKEGVPKTFKEMTQAEKRVRIAHLWKKVRLMVRARGSIRAKIDEVQENERNRFGLDAGEERYLEHD